MLRNLALFLFLLGMVCACVVDGRGYTGKWSYPRGWAEKKMEFWERERRERERERERESTVSECGNIFLMLQNWYPKRKNALVKEEKVARPTSKLKRQGSNKHNVRVFVLRLSIWITSSSCLRNYTCLKLLQWKRFTELANHPTVTPRRLTHNPRARFDFLEISQLAAALWYQCVRPLSYFSRHLSNLPEARHFQRNFLMHPFFLKDCCRV